MTLASALPQASSGDAFTFAGSLLAYEPEDVRPGWIALVLVASLGVATYLLWRSMNTQLRKIQMPPKGSSTDSGTPDLPSRDGDDLPPEGRQRPGDASGSPRDTII
ncbi:MAG: hypothetical protein H0V49_12435 [Nocardioidaceae bacterium]|nr:hypothetical protein [Nocardioidaceae bacterium]